VRVYAARVVLGTCGRARTASGRSDQSRGALRKLEKMFATKALRAAAQHAERTPLIKFIGKRSIPCA
jgi:hypothetical protein